eukprot:3639715-Prymnesium_polylepis.1
MAYGLWPMVRRKAVIRTHTFTVNHYGKRYGKRPGTRVDSGSCGLQATWACSLQGAPHLAAVLAPGQR